MTTTLRVRFDGQSLVPLDPVDLPQGEILEIDVRKLSEMPLGSPARILEIMRSAPHVSPDAVDEFERAIEEGKVAAREDGIFDDLA